MDEAGLRDALVAAGRRLAAHGLVTGAEGNLSVRLDGGQLLVTPAGRRKDELSPEDLVVVTIEPPGDGGWDPDGPRPSSDIAIHRAIYRARPDVGAIAHAHIPASMALTLAGEAPDPRVLPETALLLPRLPVVPFGAMGSRELAERIAVALSTPPPPFADAAILARHGAVGVGTGIDSAVDRLDLVDVLCRVWRDARLLAPDRPLLPPTPPP